MTNADFETLSAYVDGELDPPEAARIARLVASDERVAREVAKLTEMKEAVAALSPDVVLVHVDAPGRRRWNSLPVALAACLFAALLGGMIWLGWPAGGDGQAAQAAMLADAGLRHDAWVGAAGDDPAPVAAAPGVFAPELLAAGLSLAKVERQIEIAGRPAAHAGDVGTRGCRLSLFEMGDGEILPDVLMLGNAGTLQWATWRTGGARYLMVARHMDESRFATIGGVLRTMTESRGARSEDVIARLSEARQPCRA